MAIMEAASSSVCQLSRIPTLFSLYTRGVLAKSASDRHILDKISLIQADITTLDVDAIVNATDTMLSGGGGVDGCIHRAAGPELQRECRTLNGCQTGEAKITAGYQLPAHHVIHTVGPVGENADVLANCYRNSLELMKEHHLRTIAFASISTGVFRYPILAATRVALDTVDRIIFCVFTRQIYDTYLEEAPKYFPPTADTDPGFSVW
ncbi:hypothetical protein BDF22DRAFT_170847 [Syncephalis plumigaleata]|nr:hypothetical protein BDF22DRAFT_170847 [Syncephalis plumigaleata]